MSTDSIEARRAAEAFRDRTEYCGARTACVGDFMWLYGNLIVSRFTRDGNTYIRFNQRGWPTKITIGRMNAVARALFGEDLFFRKKGKVYLGRTLLREVSSLEDIIIPEDFRLDSQINRCRSDSLAEHAVGG
jgi:hypothetical protein